MTRVTIREIDGQEMLEAKYLLTSYALHPSPPLPDRDEWWEIVRHRQGVTCLAAYEDDRSVATAASTAMTQNVRGALLGMGGICDAADAIQFLIAGASAVAVGSMSFRRPDAALRVIEGITDYLENHGIADVNDLIGTMVV